MESILSVNGQEEAAARLQPGRDSHPLRVYRWDLLPRKMPLILFCTPEIMCMSIGPITLKGANSELDMQRVGMKRPVS